MAERLGVNLVKIGAMTPALYMTLSKADEYKTFLELIRY